MFLNSFFLLALGIQSICSDYYRGCFYLYKKKKKNRMCFEVHLQFFSYIVLWFCGLTSINNSIIDLYMQFCFIKNFKGHFTLIIWLPNFYQSTEMWLGLYHAKENIVMQCGLVLVIIGCRNIFNLKRLGSDLITVLAIFHSKFDWIGHITLG